ncbi:MAG: acetyl/propionyl/methylcrotonyl-CoA carboxylase subunit alpha [Acidimicrobiales bacterium]
MNVQEPGMRSNQARALRTRTITKVFIANRGEIALRIVRAARDYGIGSVVPYTQSESDALFVRLADQTHDLGQDGPNETYLSVERMVKGAIASGADAVHPGYGFLSEQAEFAEAVEEAGLLWIGPPPSAIRALSDKVTAKRIATSVGAPVLGGPERPLSDSEDLRATLEELGLPVVLKAAYGGGGRGMRVIRSLEEAEALFDTARRESLAAFGRDEIFVERYLDRPRHIEVQVLADHYEAVLAIGTRDCTLQRRYQKVVEEAPAPFLPADTRSALNESARAICTAAGYASAGTVEFLVGPDGSTAFLEVNTRLQVEHPVTEATTGLDLVVAQFRIAEGEPLWLEQCDLTPTGHALEFRINAEDPATGFLPSSGKLERLRLPSGPGVRVDSGLGEGDTVDGRFDSLIAKLVVVGSDRDEALRRSRRALSELEILGVETLLPLHERILAHPDFYDTTNGALNVSNTWIESDLLLDTPLQSKSATNQPPQVLIGGREVEVKLPHGIEHLALARKSAKHRNGSDPTTAGAVRSPMQGTVASLYVTNGSTVQKGEPICGIEAMKMENLLRAPIDGIVSGLSVAIGSSVRRNMVVCHLTTEQQ